jgi:hypothetical protein
MCKSRELRTIGNQLNSVVNETKLIRMVRKMIGVRVNSFNENGLGEPEQDANSALTELDKGK